MSTIGVAGSSLGSGLQQFLMADEMEPGSELSYQTAKIIYLYHPLGAKMAEGPIKIAQSAEREISIPNGPEERVREAFQREWDALGASRYIFNIATLSRVYGIASIVMGVDGIASNEPLDLWSLPDAEIFFNVLDPLNTAGSLVLSQDPNSPKFQRQNTITSSGTTYHPSRCCILFNEQPIYIAYTTSAFGFVGRSVYQRSLYPLKSFVQSMLTDDMVTVKAGVLITKIRAVGSIADKVMGAINGIKRSIVKEAVTGNVISIAPDESVETLNMMNLDGAAGYARKNILENIASGCDMPAVMLNSETFAEGFGEGTEDAKVVARYIDRVRLDMKPVYDFFDTIVMHRAWSPTFYQTIQNDFPEYRDTDYKKAFYDWKNSFSAVWPSLLKEPESEEVKVDDIKLKSLIATYQVLAPDLDPENKAILIDWMQENINSNKRMFTTPLDLDVSELAEWFSEQPEQPEAGPGGPSAIEPPRPFSSAA